MNKETSIINNFANYSSWLNSINIDETLWSKSIAKGKWSVSEIVAHIMNWDKHLLSNVIPSVQNEKGVEFPDFDMFNKKASDYAKSGISQSKLLEEAIDIRGQLVKVLNELPDEQLTKPSTTNGFTHCPHTGTPYSLIYIIEEFIEHDHHHKRQIEQFLKENNLG